MSDKFPQDDMQRAAFVDKLRVALVAASKHKRLYRTFKRSTLADPQHRIQVLLVAPGHRIFFDVVYQEFVKIRPHTGRALVSRMLRKMHLRVYQALGYTWIRWDERLQKCLDLSAPTLYTIDRGMSYKQVRRVEIPEPVKRTPVRPARTDALALLSASGVQKIS